MSALDHKELSISIYMDLSKAFDTLDHSILIDKLSHYGIKCNALKWFSSYLSNRTIYVEIDNAKSSVRHLTTSVPQGSILGPLLFLIYMNDIWNSSSLCKSFCLLMTQIYSQRLNTHFQLEFQKI